MLNPLTNVGAMNKDELITNLDLCKNQLGVDKNEVLR